MKKAPLAQVKDTFGDKAGLVAAVKKLADDELFVDRVSESKGLEHVSNSKLLHLHRTLSDVKKEFGTRAKLVEEVLKLEKRTKDSGFKTRLEGLSTPRLFDLYRAAKKRAAN